MALGAHQVVLLACKEDGPVTAWDVSNGSLLTTYKQNSSTRNGLCMVGRDHFAATQMTKGGALHFWTWHKDQVQQRCFAKQPMMCVAASPCGAFIVAGTASGTIFAWDVAGGHLLREWAAHYKAVTALSFSDDGHLLLSGGDDAVLNAWLLADVLDPTMSQAGQRLQPFHSWCEHTLPLTAVACGAGGTNALAASVSLDHTCKLYSLSTRSLLLAVTLPTSLHALAFDPGHHALYLGGGDGRVFEVPLVDRAQPSASDNLQDDGISGGGKDSASAFFPVDAHSRTVTSLSVTPDACFLLSGSDDGTACVIEMRSRQVVRTISTPSKAPISAVLTMQRPPFMPTGVRNVDTAKGLGRKGPERLEPVAALSKYPAQAGPGNGWQGPTVILEGDNCQQGSGSTSNGSGAWHAGPSSSKLAVFTPTDMSAGDTGSSASEQQIARLEEENARLKRELEARSENAQSWKKLHQDLHEFCVANVLSSGTAA